MLDKSLPFANIVMKMDNAVLKSVEMPILKAGYKFRMFCDGDEENWARIETSVGEFESEKDALEYFARVFTPRIEDVKSRCVFIEDSTGKAIATTTAWFEKEGEYAVVEYLHWVAVCGGFQGEGLGEAIVRKALAIHRENAGCNDVYLHTQTWSYKAVKLYSKLGFVMAKTETLKGCENEYKKAMQVLESVLPQEILKKL